MKCNTLYFTYAMARQSTGSHVVSEAGMDAAVKDLHEKTANEYVKALRTEAGHVAAFLVWPVIGFAGAVIGG